MVLESRQEVEKESYEESCELFKGIEAHPGGSVGTYRGW